MTHPSTFELLALHALRLHGMAEAEAVAQRFGLDPAATEEFLRDAEACGWTQHAAFAGTGGWFLTDRGRAENEHQLKAELAATGRESDVWSAYHEFLPLNARLLKACTDWQLTPAADGRLLPNEHTDPARDAGVLQELGRLAQELAPLVGKLSSVGGRRRIDDRTALAAIIYVLQTGCAWDGLPESFPISSKTAHRRFGEWVQAGVMRALHRAMLDVLGAAGQIDWSRASVDAMHVRAVKGGT